MKLKVILCLNMSNWMAFAKSFEKLILKIGKAAILFHITFCGCLQD